MLYQYLPSCDKYHLVMVQNSFCLLLKSANILRFFSFFFLLLFYLFGCAGSLLLRGLFSSCGEQELLSSYSAWLLMVVASLAKHRLQGVQASVVAAPGLQNTGSVDMAQFFCSMWYLPTPGIEPISVVLAGRFFTTEPPGNPG